MRGSRIIRCLAALAYSALAAQDGSNFRSNTRLVTINVIVRDKHGPVSNLTKDNFTIAENGKSQPIKVFSLNSVTNASQPTPASHRDTFSNAQDGALAQTGVTIVLLDRLNTLFGVGSVPYEETPTWVDGQALANAQQHLVKFVAQMGPEDIVAIYSLGRSLEVLCDFTNNRERILAALKDYHASSLTSREQAEPLSVHIPSQPEFSKAIDQERRSSAAVLNRDRAQQTTAALLSIAAHVSGIQGRKNLVWLTANLPFSESAAALALSRAGVAVYPVDARGLLPAMPAVTEDDLFSQIVRRRVVAAGQGPEPTGISEMREVAEETGGRAFTNTNDLTGALRQAADDAALTYTLGFYPAPDSLDGKFHKLKVRVVRHQGTLDVHCPSGYFALKDDTRPPTQTPDALALALRSPLESSSIHIEAHQERTDRQKSEDLRFAGSIRLADLKLAPEGDWWKDTIVLYVVQQNAAGQMLAQSESNYALQLTNEMYRAYFQSGLPFGCSVDRKPGLATIRILVMDRSNNQLGSLIIPASRAP